VLILGSAGWLMVLGADVSGMSKAEVERIWLPFVPWTLLLVVLLPVRWQRWGLPVQAALGLLLQHLYVSNW
jgi:methylthioxylose transferase